MEDKYMNILVFGATGKTGSIVVKMLLKKNHKVTAYVRNPAKITLAHSHLTIIEGSIENEKKLVETLSGKDMVITCLGSANRKESNLLANFGQVLSESMKKADVNRIIYMASAGIHQEIKGIAGFIVNRFIGHVLKDHAAAVACFMKPGFDYTILRPMQLTDGDLTARYKTSTQGIPGNKPISRNNVAHFIVDVVEKGHSLNASIGMSGE